MNVSALGTMKATKNLVSFNKKIGNNISLTIAVSPSASTPMNVRVMTTSAEIKRGIVKGKHFVGAKREITCMNACIGPRETANKPPVLMASTASVTEGVLTTYDTYPNREEIVDNWNSKTMWRRRHCETVKMGMCPSQEAVANAPVVGFTPAPSFHGATYHHHEQHHQEREQPTADNRIPSSDIPRPRRRSQYSNDHRVSQQLGKKYQREQTTSNDEENELPRKMPYRPMDERVQSRQQRKKYQMEQTTGNDEEDEQAPRKMPYRPIEERVQGWRRIPRNVGSTTVVEPTTAGDDGSTSVGHSRSVEDVDSPTIVRTTATEQRRSTNRKRKADVQLHKEDDITNELSNNKRLKVYSRKRKAEAQLHKEEEVEEQFHEEDNAVRRSKKRKIEHPSSQH